MRDNLTLHLSSIILHKLLQLRRHLLQRLSAHLNLAAARLPYDQVHLTPFLVAVREFFARMSPAALRPFERGPRDGLADVEHVLQIKREMPARIELNITADFRFG